MPHSVQKIKEIIVFSQEKVNTLPGRCCGEPYASRKAKWLDDI